MQAARLPTLLDRIFSSLYTTSPFEIFELKGVGHVNQTSIYTGPVYYDAILWQKQECDLFPKRLCSKVYHTNRTKISCIGTEVYFKAAENLSENRKEK